MAITLADFTNIWASTSPLTPYSFSTSNYEEGWNFIGSTPPARQMWDSIQKQNDEKMKYIVDNFLPLTGGIMTGSIKYAGANNREFRLELDNADTNIDFGWRYSTEDGALLALRNADYNGGGTDAGSFGLSARAGGNTKTLYGNSSGELAWAGVAITDGSFIKARIVNTGANPTNGQSISAPAESGYQFVCWVMSASSGNTIPTYIQNATSNPGRVWYVGTLGTGNSIDCTALYVRKW